MKPIALPKSDRNVTIARDRHGVPCVRGESFLDALYGLGYMHGLDRGTQLQFGRSIASGRAAEQIVADRELMETDRFFRRFGLHRGLEHEVRLLSGASQERLSAYCEGVNVGFLAMGRSWPMWATSYESSTWDPEAVILIGRLLSFGGLATSQLQSERLVLELIHAGVDERILKALFKPRLDQVDFELLRQVKIANGLSNEALEVLQDLPRLAGSNAWAVAPHRSESGAALLAADPHLEVNRLPGIWYEACLQWERVDHHAPAAAQLEGAPHYIMGATLPGCPLFAVARNHRVGWGVTYMKGDTFDYFIEDCRLSEQGWEYRRDDQWRLFDVCEERMLHKGAEPETMRVYHNDLGVLEGDPNETGPGLQLSLAWTGAGDGSGRAMESWLELILAHDAKEAMAIAKRCQMPTLCFVMADREGHIGLQGCGRFPRRPEGYSGLTPIPAWDSKLHWQGWMAERLLPHIYDPEQGFVATANEEWPEREGVALVTKPANEYRKVRIDEQLTANSQATIQQMQALQYDVYSVQAERLLPLFLEHMPASEVKTTLAEWDRCFDPDSTSASLFMRLYWHVILELLGRQQAIGWRRMVHMCSRNGYSLMVLTGADRLLLDDTAQWWTSHDRAKLIRRAAEQVTMEDAVPWSRVNNFHFADRFFGNAQVGRLLGFNSRQHPMRGCHATTFQGHVLQTATREVTFAPSYHFVTDMQTDEAWTNLPGGPSENRFSKWYKNDVARWLSGEFKQLTLSES